MNIGQAAAQAGLPAKTIRYYEDIGLVKPERDANGYRAFAPNDIHKLPFLAQARALGCSIDDCRALLARWESTARASADVRRIAQDHLQQIEAKITDLGRMRDTLKTLVRDCAGDDRPDCPILNTLGNQPSS